jgi:aryl-alcohol dehydrogenase-like predicted oxidoreductase
MPEDQAVALLAQVHRGGISRFDTAEAYKTGNPFEDSPTDAYNTRPPWVCYFSKQLRETFTLETKFYPGGQKNLAVSKLSRPCWMPRCDGCKNFLASICITVRQNVS